RWRADYRPNLRSAWTTYSHDHRAYKYRSSDPDARQRIAEQNHTSGEDPYRPPLSPDHRGTGDKDQGKEHSRRSVRDLTGSGHSIDRSSCMLNLILVCGSVVVYSVLSSSFN